MFKKNLSVLLPALLLATLILSCSLGTESTPLPLPSTLTSMPSPTAPELLGETYTGEEMGFSVGYPDDWGAEPDAGQVIIATSRGFEPAVDEGAAFAAFADPSQDLDAGSLEDLWGMTADVFEADVGEPEPFVVGGEEALRGTFENTEDGFHGWLIAAFSNDYGYFFVAVVNPVDTWGEYEDTFSAMLDSVEFFPPVAAEPMEGPADEVTSRDDVPTPPDAEVVLDLPEIQGYMTYATVVEAAAFVEDNWPGYGWEAEADNFLYMIDEESSLLILTKEGKIATVAISADAGSGRTEVSIVIGEEE
jgi:hypothetical protein